MSLAAYLKAVAGPGQDVNRLFAFLGVEVESFSPGQAVLRLPLRPEFSQGASALAGGVQATLLDEAMAHAVLSGLEEHRRAATIEMSVRYLKPLPLASFDGTTLRCAARIVKQGRNVAFVEAEILALPGDAVLAKASASFMILSPTAL